jgi:nitroreductase/dihydropteridine reductase
MSIIENLQWRYATQTFDTSKEIPSADLETILQAGNLAPTAYGLQPFQMVVVTDQTVKESLVEHAFGQAHVAHNSALIVLAARTDIDEAYITEYTTRIETIRGLPAGTIDGYKAMMIGDLTNRTPEARLAWAQKQSYIALGIMMAAASELHIDNHALEGFNPAKFDEILGLTEKHLTATTLLALGYRSAEDAWQHYAKVRKDIKDIVVTI